MSNSRKTHSLRTLLAASLLIGFSGSARAELLVFSGTTYWTLSLYGVVTSPSGESFETATEVAKLRGMIVEDEDTLVFDFAAQRFEVFESITPSALIATGDDFELFDPESDVALYAEAALGWDCHPSLTQIDTPGAVLHVGHDNAVLCDRLIDAGGPAPDDGDGDGIPDGTDNCAGVANPDQANNDGDPLGDVCDPDDDNDGLADIDEIEIYGTNPFLADSDGDGYSDPAEITAGTDPLDPDSFPIAAVPLMQGPGILALCLLLSGAGALALHGRRRS